jgi:hypothetical protein
VPCAFNLFLNLAGGVAALRSINNQPLEGLSPMNGAKMRIATLATAITTFALGAAAHAQTAGPAYDTLGASAQTDLVGAITKILPPVLGVLVVVKGSKMLVNWIGARAR